VRGVRVEKRRKERDVAALRPEGDRHGLAFPEAVRWPSYRPISTLAAIAASEGVGGMTDHLSMDERKLRTTFQVLDARDFEVSKAWEHFVS
jgi:hypothetical protein